MRAGAEKASIVGGEPTALRGGMINWDERSGRVDRSRYLGVASSRLCFA